jgi:peptide/nickel transport system substrate-binding protein
VPKDSDTKEAYGDRPIASGPYKVENYQRGSALTLVRNENWDAASDPNRPAYPDRFEFELDADEETEGPRLLEGKGTDAYAVPFGGVLSPKDYPKLEEPAIKSRFVNGPGPCVNYLTFNTQKLKDPDVRHAIALSIDRQKYLELAGGELTGSIAESVIPPELPGYVAPDLGLAPTGDPDAAKKLLEGKSVPPLHLMTVDSPGVGSDQAALIQANLKAVGLEVIIEPRPDEEHYAILDSDESPEMADVTGWCFDWPTAMSVVVPVLGPNDDGTNWGSNNSSKYLEPKFSDQLQELKSSTEGPDEITKKLVSIANEIQTTDWPLMPTLIENTPEVVGANVTNVGISSVLGEIDLNTLAVKK